jgi:hypothetical protein
LSAGTPLDDQDGVSRGGEPERAAHRIEHVLGGTTLYARGRDIEESETAVQFSKETCKWTMLGPAAEVHRSDERRVVLDALQDADEPMSPREIADLTGQSHEAVRQMLVRMAKAGEVARPKTGRYASVPPVTGVTGVTADAEALDSDEERVSEPPVTPVTGGVTVKRCPCGEAARPGQRDCPRCHAESNRKYRKKQRAELQRLRAKESLN